MTFHGEEKPEDRLRSLLLLLLPAVLLDSPKGYEPSCIHGMFVIPDRDISRARKNHHSPGYPSLSVRDLFSGASP